MAKSVWSEYRGRSRSGRWWPDTAGRLASRAVVSWSPAFRLRPCMPPRAAIRLVDAEPSQRSPSNPPATAMYARPPARRAPNVSRSPGLTKIPVQFATCAPLMRGSKSAPVIATMHACSACRCGPESVHSRVASISALPTRRFAARCAKRSIAPPGGTPAAIALGRPRSCTVVNSPGSTTRRTAFTLSMQRTSRGPRHETGMGDRGRAGTASPM